MAVNFFPCQTHSFLYMTMLSYCPKINQSELVINSIFLTISEGRNMFPAGHCTCTSLELDSAHFEMVLSCFSDWMQQ
jgi:hypothetical protein